MLPFLDRFIWKGNGRVYSLPWLRNRIEYSADPDRVKEYLKGGGFTRSQLTMDMLTRFHLSNNSIVVSDDKHAQLLREIFLERMPSQDRFHGIARELVNEVFITSAKEAADSPVHISSKLIRGVYISLLSNLLGADLQKPLEEFIDNIDFRPGTRPMHLDGIMYAFGLQLPGFSPMRTLIDLVFFKGEHYTRNIARKLEKMVLDYALPKQDSWYSALLGLKESGKLTQTQLKGELTSILVSSYALSSSMSSMLLCLAARREYVNKIRHDESLAKCFVNEVLRLYPPFRQFGYEKKGVWEKSGRPKDDSTDFMVSAFGLHRNESAWDEPESFHPERFLTPGSVGGCKFLPFGMGSRSCVGRLYSTRMLIEVLKYVCSEECGFELDLPTDYEANQIDLPIGASGRLVSFPLDDRVYVRQTNNF